MNEELLIKMYVDEHKSLREIARQFNTTHATVTKYLRRLGVDIRVGSDSAYYASRRKWAEPNVNKRVYVKVMENHIGRKLNKDEVVHHIDFNRTHNHITNLYLFESHTLHNAYHTYIRSHSYIEPQQWVDTVGQVYKTVLDYDFLWTEYVVLDKSVNEISKAHPPVSRQSITKALKGFGIWHLRPPKVN